MPVRKNYPALLCLHIKTFRPFLLLEVMIALAIVTLALFPLLSPHLYIYRQQMRFVDTIDLDIAINNRYGAIIERLYRGEISWAHIEQNSKLPLSELSLGENEGFSRNRLNGNYHLKIIKSKKNDRFGLYLLELIIDPTADDADLRSESLSSRQYRYTLFAARNFPA